MIKVIVDSCADLTGELLEKYDLDYAHMNTVCNGKQQDASLTWEEYSPRQLYDIMRGGIRVTTTQVPVEEFNRIYKKYLDMGYDIIYIACASKQSGSVNTGYVTAKQILKDYPGRRIECIDALNASIGEGMLGIYASELVREGKSFDTVVELVKQKRNHVNEYVTVQTLDFLRKSGRVKASKAFLGNLMGVKPIIISDADGAQTPVLKAKGRLNSLRQIVNSLADSIEDSENQYIYIAHADCAKEELNLVKEMINNNIKSKGIITVYIGPIIGASIGPEAIGVFGFGKEITHRATED